MLKLNTRLLIDFKYYLFNDDTTENYKIKFIYLSYLNKIEFNFCYYLNSNKYIFFFYILFYQNSW